MKTSTLSTLFIVVLLELTGCSGSDGDGMSMNGNMNNGDPETLSANLFARTQIDATSEDVEPFAVDEYSWEFDDTDTFNDVLGVE